MAISTSAFFSNSLIGVPQVAGEMNIYDNDTNPKLALGTKFERADGAVFRYSHFSTAVTAGQVLAYTNADISVSFAVGNTCLAPTSTAQMPDEQPGVYPGSLGSRYLIVGLGGNTTANQYAGSYVNIAVGTGKNFTYRVKSNTASSVAYNSSGSTGYTRLTLADKLVEAVDATSTIAICGCKYYDLTSVTSANPNAIGVNVTTRTAGNFGWVQTRGLIGANIDGAVPIGSMVSISSSAAGKVMAATVANGGTANLFAYPVVGYAAAIGTSTGMSIINVQLE